MSRRLPPLNALRAFESAARFMSFTKAADHLHVTQAAISHQVKALEEWVGAPLFQRLNRGLSLTEAGRIYLPLLTEAFDMLADATALVMTGSAKRVLSISTLDSFASMWLLPRLARFRERFPDIDVRIISVDREKDSLMNGDVDVDLRYGDGNWPGLAVTHFLNEDIFPVCTPAIRDGEHPLVELSDLRHHTLLHDVMIMDWRIWLEEEGVMDVDSSRGPGFNHSYLVTQAAINGDGVALGRGALVIDAIKRGQLVKPFALSLPSDFSYYFVCSRTAAKEPSIVAFRGWLLEEAAITQADLEQLAGESR
ncbi:transcriptional regulator GcvA [Govanella unica]|uniref:Transcriptional regulator GcvA n=1 Tax=Govanella unica TaxID=2975056 RepID=A0A9X3Z642_9PROT|nr:transcriptional regulator GcvA [Govania unica]MDA5192692.1 transcriptional regulator GcvA [Govania unica]